MLKNKIIIMINKILWAHNSDHAELKEDNLKLNAKESTKHA